MVRRGEGIYLRGKTWWLDFRHDGTAPGRVMAAVSAGAQIVPIRGLTQYH